MLRGSKSSLTTMSRLSYNLTRKGQLNLPGSTYASKKATEELLKKDAETHHCFFRSAGLHNHLSHHLLAAYDLGASAGQLQKIYDDEARTQRPIFLEEKDKDIVVSVDNWIQYLGNQSAYGAFVKFFSGEVQNLGASGAVERYIFSEDANKEPAEMLIRLVSGAVHPFILLGYGAEFGDDTLIATGLSQAAMHSPQLIRSIYPIDTSPPSQSLTLLELLHQVYESEVLTPPLPYDPDALINARYRNALSNGGAEEIKRLCSQYHISDSPSEADLASKIQEIMWVSTLLMASTGKKGRKPRLDFFLMHLVNSSIFLRPLCNMLKEPAHKAALLRTYIPLIVVITLSRGRPRINPELLMTFTAAPRPPIASTAFPKPSDTVVGNPLDDADYNPWPVMIEAVQYHQDSHVPKALRTLIYAAQHYGDTPPGGAIGSLQAGSDGEERETHIGSSKMDGTIFVRAAGMVMENLGWVRYGQKEGEWDRSALGWDAAWEGGD
ncbi:hypothetical protein B0H34DRAFT_710596 [Crassisporium funariophilum]|nr:hypothetical protein B0H34DRAFT_710596 [Crassisporium funariophilum]